MSRDYDENAVDLVRRTLTAVADATPVGPPPAGGLDELVREADRDGAVPLVPRDGAAGGRRTPPRRRAVALAAAVLAVVLAATATWLARSDHHETPPTSGTNDGALPERLEAGWLPDPLAGTEPERTATAGLGVDPDAAVFTRDRADQEGAVMTAAGVDDAAADAMAAALARIVQADRSTPPSSGIGGHTGDGRPISVASWISVGEELLPLVQQVEDGARPSDVTAPGWTTTPVSIDWVPGVARSETVRYGDPFTGPWVELATTAGQLPGPSELDALLPLGEGVRLGDRDAWAVTRTGASAGGDEHGGMWTVLWQEADGVVGSVTTSGIAWDDVQRIVRDARLDDDPAPATRAEPRTVADGEVGGVAYTVEAWVDSWRGLDDGAATVCWRVRVDRQAAPVPTCQAPSPGFSMGGEVGGYQVIGAVVGPDVAEVRVDEGTVASTDVVSVGGGRAHLALAVATEADAHDAMVSLVDSNGQASEPIELLYE